MPRTHSKNFSILDWFSFNCELDLDDYDDDCGWDTDFDEESESDGDDCEAEIIITESESNQSTSSASNTFECKIINFNSRPDELQIVIQEKEEVSKGVYVCN